ncbi:MAG: DsbA family oxidoreductase, partial [Nocardioides sp.]
RQGELEEALFAAYFTDATNVADHAALRDVALAAGLDATRVEEVLASDAFTDEVHADVEQAAQYGITGVPFFVVDQRYGVSGAQPADVLRQVLERAWGERTPALQLVPGPDACGPEGCSD